MTQEILTQKIVWEFFKSFCVLFFITYIFSKLSVVKNHLKTKPDRMKEKLTLALLFGALGCVGSAIGIEFSGSLINTRVIGVAVGGLLGGPLVGVLSGAMAAFHRIFLVKAGPATAVICGVSMIIEGAFAGYFSRYSYKFKRFWVQAVLTVTICELFRKVMLLLFVQPFEHAVLLVRNMTMPMLVINALGVVLFVTYIQKVEHEQEEVKARQSELVLSMTDRISACLKHGLIAENLTQVVKTLEENTDFSHVVITNKTAPIISNLSREELAATLIPPEDLRRLASRLEAKEGAMSIKRGDIRYIAEPLLDNSELAGFLLLGKKQPPSVYDSKLASGLGKLFSSQLTVGNLEYRASLLREAEIKVLQTQINPHFLFNSLTIISSLCRSEPSKARFVIDHLAEFYRKNLRINSQMVSLQEEISHIEAYLEIIKARYPSKIKIQYEIEELADCYLPPLSLQPLVENSIKHGLLPKREGGVVSIRARREAEENSVRIEIEDDGLGFDLSQPQASDSNRVGLANVRKRLQNYFGDDLSWKIDTGPSAGTKITLIIPAVSNT